MLTADGKSARRVLVVDDERDIADSMVSLLRLEGHAASACYDGGQVIDRVRADDPEILILDIGLPNRNGFQIAEEIRQRFGRRVTIIGLTGQYILDSDRLLAKMRGFDHFLLKPAEPAAVFALIAQARRGTA